MSGIYEWVRNISYYLIFMTVVSNLLPDKKYEKYLKLFAGMVLILLVLKPLTGGLNLEQRIAYYFESISFQKEADELATEFLGMEGKRLDSMVDGYQEAVAADIKAMAEGDNLAAKWVEVEIERDRESERFGRVIHITAVVFKEEGGREEGVIDAGDGAVIGIDPVEPVKVSDRTKEESISAEDREKDREQRQMENSQVNSLRRRIAEYYDLEENEIEIQLEDG